MKKQKLFETNASTITGPKRGDISLYEYLSRSNRSEIKKLTDWWNEVFERCRLSGVRKLDISSRIKSKSEDNHTGALFELFVYEFFKTIGFKIVSGRKLKNGSPDFIASDNGDTKFYLEATCIMDVESKVSTKSLKENVIDAIRSVRSDKFRLLVNFRGAIERPPNKKKIRIALEKWLSSLDYNHIEKQYSMRNDICDIEHKSFRVNGLVIGLHPLPKGLNQFSRGKDIIWGIGGQAILVKTNKDICNKIKEKAKQCRGARLPVIIALNLLDVTADLDDIWSGLFGELSFSVFHNKGKISSVEPFRRKKGAFILGNDVINTSITGVVIFNGIGLTPIPIKQPLYLINPYRKSKDFRLEFPNILTVDPLTESGTLENFEMKLKSNWESLRSKWPFQFP